MNTQNKTTNWINETLKSNQYIRINLPIIDDEKFSCPHYNKKISGEKRNPTEGDPCMFCADPRCPLHPKVYM